jgi:uncharacterized protein (DUF1501 family)
MNFIQTDKYTRRAFLRRSGQLAFTGAALPLAMNLAAIGEAAAFNATDYKALVCIFLYGGNDHYNTIVPYDTTNYDLYNAIRGGGGSGKSIALDKLNLKDTLLNPTIALPGGRQFAFHPEMKKGTGSTKVPYPVTGLTGLFNAGKAAALFNVGPLVVPMTLANYNSKDRFNYPRPPKLFSHNDQQSLWQSSSPEGSSLGWGGKIGDLALSANTNSAFTCISTTGNAVYLAGQQAQSYQVDKNGSVKIKSLDDSNVYGSTAVKNALRELVMEGRTNILENEYNIVTKRQVNSGQAINDAIGKFSPSVAPFAAIPNTNLGDQLKMVARLIAGRSDLGAKRQVFFVSMGGFDTHGNLISSHANLMKQVNEAMSQFYDATVALGVSDKVTTFTASDFGRTLVNNGDGSDHGWGGHHLIVGGAVKGAAFYGTPPPLSITESSDSYDQWHVGSGRLLPSTSMDQYAATLAKWFGVSDTELIGTRPGDGVMPYLRNFGGADYPRDLGFMR